MAHVRRNPLPPPHGAMRLQPSAIASEVDRPGGYGLTDPIDFDDHAALVDIGGG